MSASVAAAVECWDGYAPWIKRFRNAKEQNREQLYVEGCEMPDSVGTSMTRLLAPLPIDEEAMQRNISSAFQEIYQNNLHDYAFHPHAVFTPGLLMLLASKQLKSKQPLTGEALDAALFDGVSRSVDVLRMYTFFLYHCRSHFVNRTRIFGMAVRSAFDTQKERLRAVLQTFLLDARKLDGSLQLAARIAEEDQTRQDAIVYYSEPLASAYASLSFALAVRQLNIMELAICEILLIDPADAIASGLLTPAVAPKKQHLSLSFRAALQLSAQQILKDVQAYNEGIRTIRVDMEAIKNVAPKPPHHVSLMCFFQWYLVEILGVSPLQSKDTNNK